MKENPIKVLVVEDEMIIGAKISLLLTELGYEVMDIIPRAEEALLYLTENTPDIVLLDIQLKGRMDGIALAQIMRQTHHIPVIFLTANSDDATFQRAKETKPYAFLTKPFKKLDLQRAIELALSLMATPNVTEEKPIADFPFILSDRIFVHHKEKKVKILLDTVLYVEAERNYCRIITQTKDYLLTMPMKNLEEKLPAALFQRIHRSYIVNLRHVDEVDENTVLVGGKSLLLSKAYRKELLTRIQSI
ncbi:MAG: response regulator [Bacteroidia bacterium]